MKKILVIGSLNMDFVIDLHHTPEKGETILGKFAFEAPGGKGANQASAAGRLGADVSMLGVVGRDDAGQKMIKVLKDSFVKTSQIEVAGEKTGLALILVNADANNSIVVMPNANDLMIGERVLKNEQLIKKSDIIMLQMEIPLSGVYEAIWLAKKHGKTIILNPAPVNPDFDRAYLHGIDFLTPNENELSLLSNVEISSVYDAEIAAKKLLELGVKNVIVTLGDKGAMLVSKEKSLYIEPKKVVAVDTTAAGDSFCGAFAARIARGDSVENAVLYANAAASVCVTKKGASASLPFEDEVIL